MWRFPAFMAALCAGAAPSVAAAPASAQPERISIKLRSDQLTASDGRPVSLPALVRSSRRTILSFTYSGCSTVCPVSDVIMAQVEKLTRKRPAADVRLVTITIDPANDTPHKLARHAARLGSDPRRIWLTGDFVSVRSVLDGLGMQFGSLDEHGSFFLLIAPRSNKVLRMRGQPSPQRLVQALDTL
jgi:protein SCO1/2